MSEEAMSPESRQRLAELRADLAAEREAHETLCILHLNVDDIQELAGGYVNRKVQAMASYFLDTEDRYARNAARPVRRRK
jgi:hypothetical protein